MMAARIPLAGTMPLSLAATPLFAGGVDPIAEAVQAVSAVFRVPSARLLGEERGSMREAEARDALVLLLVARNGCSLLHEDIAKRLGRERSTITKAVGRAGRRRREDEDFARHWESARKRLKAAIGRAG